MEDYHAAGFSFTLFSLAGLASELWELCRRHAGMIDAIELITANLEMSDLNGDPLILNPIDGIELYVGLAHSSVHEKVGAKFSHAVSFGYKWGRRDEAVASLAEVDKAKSIAGLVFQINLSDNVGERLAEIDTFASKNELKASANIRLAAENPAKENFDDSAIAKRVGEVVEAAADLRHTSIQLDTFVDVDRGYHPRHGLIDQVYNFRAAGRLLVGNS